jgi:CheY-like chemotaxis protein
MAVALRLVSSNSPSGLGAGSASGPRSRNGNDRKSTILVVEDEVLQRYPVAEFLRNAGYRVLEASNADDARAIFKSGEPIEVVFSDVSMPGTMNGFGLAQWVRKEYPDVHILLTSGDDMKSAPGYGSVDGPVIRKPFLFETVIQHIRRLLLH